MGRLSKKAKKELLLSKTELKRTGKAPGARHDGAVRVYRTVTPLQKKDTGLKAETVAKRHFRELGWETKEVVSSIEQANGMTQVILYAIPPKKA